MAGVITPSNLTNGASVTSGTTYNTASVTPAGSALLILSVYSCGTSATPAAPTITGNGLTWVQINSLILDSTAGKYQRISWYRALDVAPSAGAITITHATSCQACSWSVDQFTGVDTGGSSGSSAVVQTASGQAASGAWQFLQFGSPFSDPDNILFASHGHGAQEGMTPCSGFSELCDRSNGKATSPGQLETVWAYGYENMTFGWSTGSHYAAIAIEIGSAPGQGYAPGQPTQKPIILLEFDMNDQTSTTRQWVDISNRVISLNYKHQRSFELDRVETGDASFVCRNNDRALDPNYTAGPYYGHLDADRFVRLRVLWKGRWHAEFHGYLQSIDEDRSDFNNQTATLVCKNGFDPLSMETLSPSQYTLTTSLGVTNGDLTYIARSAQGGGQGSSPGMQVGHLFGGFGELQGNYVGGNTITIAYISGGTNPPITSDDVGVDETTGAIHVQLQASTGQAQNIMNAINSHAVASRLVYVKPAPGSDASGFVGAMSATPLNGGFPAEASGARIVRCLTQITPVWPDADRFIDAGTATIQQLTFEKKDKVSALSHIQDVCATELGLFYMDGRNCVHFHGRTHRVGASPSATFSDTPGAGEYAYQSIKPIYDNSKIWNQWTVTMNQTGSAEATEVTVNDTTSQNKHRIRNQSVTVLVSAAAAVTTFANKMLARYKDQVARYDSMVCAPGFGDSSFDVLFDLDFSSCITVERSPVAGYGVSSPQLSNNHFIEGYDVKCDETGNWTFTFPLSPYSFSQ